MFDTPEEETITVPAAGTATPYPSQLVVDQPGVVRRRERLAVAVAHDRPDDLDLMLVGPQGQAVVLMSDAGGANAVEDRQIDLDDESDQPCPTTTRSTSSNGEFKPTDYGDGAGRLPRSGSCTQLHRALVPSTARTAAGTWSLYVVDDSGDESGTGHCGWRLEIRTSPRPGPTRPSCRSRASGRSPTWTSRSTASTPSTAADMAFLLVGPRGQQALLLERRRRRRRTRRSPG